MRVHELAAPPGTSTIFGSDVAHLIEKVGAAAFSPRLFRAARQAIGCVHMNAFAFARSDRRTLVLAENVGSSQIARDIGSHYIEHYWEMDPINAWHVPLTPGFRLIETESGDIGNADYRYHCYTAVHIDARISICETRPEGAMRVNFYRRKGFSPAQKDAIVESTGLLMPLLWRHGLNQCNTPTTEGDFEERLAEVAPGLTKREREVCALIAFGVTSEGIGLRLGISLNTVLTYRKRAYTRLRISSQNQLLRLTCAPLHDRAGRAKS